MALTRKFLTALGVEAEKVDEIISAHAETVDALKEQIAQSQASADELKNAKDKIAELEDKIADVKADAAYKVKYEALKDEYKTYKADVEAKETRATKQTAYRKLLENAGVSEKRLDSILKVSADIVDGIKFDEDNNVIGADIVKPPANAGGRKSKEDILAIKDAGERQRAIAENLDLFE